MPSLEVLKPVDESEAPVEVLGLLLELAHGDRVLGSPLQDEICALPQGADVEACWRLPGPDLEVMGRWLDSEAF